MEAPLSQPTHLDPSALGTKEYWDEAYASEIKNHAENPDDVGVIWFSDSSAEEKVVGFLEGLAEKMYEELGEHIREQGTIRVLDLGTGNGHLLFALQDEGWRAEMVGVDYSQASVQLARRIQQNRGDEMAGENGVDSEMAPPAQFEQFDILEDEPGPWLGAGFDIVLDKGTFDAISLNSETDGQGQRGFEKYGRHVERLVKRGGFFLITSCNWTEEELRKWFESDELAYHDRIRYRSFTFGGVKGQSISSVCFRRRGPP